MSNEVVMLWSGGKDSALALHRLLEDGVRVAALVTTCTREYDRISMHGVRRSLLHAQAHAIGLPLHEVFITQGADNAEYERQLSAALTTFHDRGIRTVAFGDIFLEDLREYRERQTAALGMQCLFPLWQVDTRDLIETFFNTGFRGVTVCVDPRKLDERFVGRELDWEFVAELPEDVDPCGENGEYHSFVYDGPFFEKPLSVRTGEKVLRDSFLFSDLVSEERPHEATLEIQRRA